MNIHPVFIQAFYYAIVMGLMTAAIGFIQKGFFWKYIRVRMSFGKLLIVKVKAINRDYFEVGRIDEGQLVYKCNTGTKKGKEEKRIDIKYKSSFYRSLGTSWIDVDEEKNCVIHPDYKKTSGFDAVKFNSLYLRALYRPQLTDQQQRLILLAVIGIGIICLAIAFLSWQNYANIGMITQYMAKGTTTPGTI